MIVALADLIGGSALWVGDDGMLRHTYSQLRVETHKQVATEKLPTDAVNVRMLFDADEPSPAAAAGDAAHRQQGGWC